MTRTSNRRIAAAVAIALTAAASLVLALRTESPASAACPGQTRTDTTGEPFIVDLDVVSAVAELGCATAGEWRVTIRTADSWATTSLFRASMSIDTDGDRSNGCEGAEYTVEIPGQGSNLTGVVRRSPTCERAGWTVTSTAQATHPDGQTLVIAFPHAAVGAPASLSWHAYLSSNASESVDFVPNQPAWAEETGLTAAPTTTSTTVPGATTTTSSTGPGATTTTPGATTPGATTTTAPPAGEPAVARVAGEDRVATAVAVSKRTYAAPDSATAAVIARADDFADALVGAPLAARTDAPILLALSQGLPTSVQTELQRVLRSRSNVFILGGSNAIGSAADEQIRALGLVPVRLAGDDRYATATVVADLGLRNPATVLLATGLDFPDALAAGTAAIHTTGAVLLTADGAMPAATRTYLSSHPPQQRFAVGRAIPADTAATPITGTDRYDTAVAIARRFNAGATGAAVTSGVTFADGLAAGVLAAREGGPLLLSPPAELHAAAVEWLRSERGTVRRASIVGGRFALAEGVLQAVRDALVA